MKRVGLLTSGGDCQALNAAMRGVVKSLRNSNTEVEIYGFLNVGTVFIDLCRFIGFTEIEACRELPVGTL